MPGAVNVCLLDTVTVFVLFYLPLLHQLLSSSPLSVTLSLATVDRLQAGKGTTGKDFCLRVERALRAERELPKRQFYLGGGWCRWIVAVRTTEHRAPSNPASPTPAVTEAASIATATTAARATTPPPPWPGRCCCCQAWACCCCWPPCPRPARPTAAGWRWARSSSWTRRTGGSSWKGSG